MLLLLGASPRAFEDMYEGEPKLDLGVIGLEDTFLLHTSVQQPSKAGPIWGWPRWTISMPS